MIISFIGMSGMGKSYWSKQLVEQGFQRISIDNLIEVQLKRELERHGLSRINGVAKWMGQPYEPHFKEREQTYLEFERQAMQATFDQINRHPNQDYVIDTTGSVIYLGDQVCNQLKQSSLVVNFVTPQSVMDKMYQQYITNPKPVIWGNSYQPQANQTPQQALETCYPLLLQYRLQLYQKYADLALSYHILKDPNFTVHELLHIIKSHQPQ